jgi:hypothetical protein
VANRLCHDVILRRNDEESLFVTPRFFAALRMTCVYYSGLQYRLSVIVNCELGVTEKCESIKGICLVFYFSNLSGMFFAFAKLNVLLDSVTIRLFYAIGIVMIYQYQEDVVHKF